MGLFNSVRELSVDDFTSPEDYRTHLIAEKDRMLAETEVRLAVEHRSTVDRSPGAIRGLLSGWSFKESTPDSEREPWLNG